MGSTFGGEYSGISPYNGSNISDCHDSCQEEEGSGSPYPRNACECSNNVYYAEQELGIDCNLSRILYYYHPDYLGHNGYITDITGRPYQYFHYSAFGESLIEKNTNYGQFSTPYRFNGKELDPETGNYYYGARYYNPRTSIWLSVDPMSDQSPGLTPYNFVSNNPVMRVDPTGMLDDEWDYNLKTRELTWVSDKGGSETQYVNIKDGDQQVAQTSVSGDKVYAYKLKNSVFVTNTDRNFNDQTYNQNSGYEYNTEELKLRDHYLSEDTPIRRALMSAESSGNAIPISYTGEENKYGYTVMRLKMMGAAIDQVWDVMPTPSPSVRRVGKLNIGSVGINTSVRPLKGYSGAKALTGSNSWNMFLKANTGNFSGKGWQKKAAAAYYKSKFYTP